ncbi:Serine/threonine-protein kinase PknB [Stieleria neptunia]|uniref:Serine/threonine-protein kinase PknB n=1 Tax=Stieleria neptunia TaxID=2527979 RepID=A0A518HIU5_9BACT|nr:serine/threonine-protein kinase [Stieleria neptunia]QDV40771.1 Serine/threonine-protein kinase PknB [Stieleria neptunia]
MVEAGQRLLAFEILGTLGAGAMGEVYLAHDTTLDRQVAIKVLSVDVADNASIGQRFKREAQTLAALNHPCVAQIYGYHQTDELCFLSLEYVDGKDLSEHLADGPMSVEDTIRFAERICEGLGAAHAKGIIHRDLKPGNIRIGPDGSVKILDFGLARFVTSTEPEPFTATSSKTTCLPLTVHGAILGTPAYMSPEQAQGLPIDRRTDIWSLGCVLYECLAGKPVFDGRSLPQVMAAVLQREPDWQALPETTPEPLRALLKRCLQKDREHRFDNIAEIRARILRLDDGAASAGSTAVALAQQSVSRRDWPTAYDILRQADQRGELCPEGLEMLGECARWTGRFDEIVDPIERAHEAYVARADQRGAVRTALELSHANDDAGRTSLATAWLGRADELVAKLPEGPEHAWHAWFHNRCCMAEGNLDGQERQARRALQLARRYEERNVEALALVDLSHVATTRGESQATLDLIQRATSMALGGEIDLFATGMVFCNTIWACRCRGEWQRAQEWTESATRWVNRQQIEYFPGMCRVHRSEVLRVRGDLVAAERESEAATRQVSQALPAYAVFPWSELGEVRRRRGNFAAAMTAFQQAISLGWDPQPGLALLLMQRGDAASAHRSIERTFREPRPTMVCEDRVNLLVARATIAVAVDELAIAESAIAELAGMADRNNTPWDNAAAAHTRGLLDLASGGFGQAVEQLTRARRWWIELNTPYELANTCVLLAKALHADGDPTRAKIELAAARDGFARIGAEFDRDQAQALLDKFDGRALRLDRPGSTPTPHQALMSRRGDTWMFKFNGRQLQLRNTRGLEHLSKLLRQPGVDCWAVDLAGSGGAFDRGDAGEMLDASAREAYRRRAEELQSELADLDPTSDPVNTERIRTELDAIAQTLAAAVGLGGRPRRAGSAIERARQSVTKGIRGAIRKVTDADAELGRYLEATIKTGTACRFEAQLREAVDWVVEDPSSE